MNTAQDSPGSPGTAPQGLQPCLGALQRGLALLGADGHPQPHTGQRTSVVTLGLAQLLACVPGCQHEPHWRHRPFGEKSQPAHLGCKHHNLEVCMEPPSPPLQETQKATKKDNIWKQTPKKRARARICCLYLCTLVHTLLSVPYHKHICFTHLLPRFTYFQCTSRYRIVHPYPLHYILQNCLIFKKIHM